LLDQPGGGDIVGVHHQPRRQAEKIDAPIRLLDQDGGDDGSCRAPTVTRSPGRGIQGAGQPLVEPDRARLRAPPTVERGLAAINGCQLPAQG
jgi:hypothetical protein